MITHSNSNKVASNLPIAEVSLLTKANFAPFGEVIETHNAHNISINKGYTTRFHALAHVQLEQAQASAQAIINIFRSTAWPEPLSITMLEQHPLGSQAFIPLDTRPFLVVVGSKNTQGDPKKIHVFITNGRQGINFFQGIWHHPQLILADTQEFIVVDRQGKDNNLVEQDLPSQLHVGINLKQLRHQYLENK